MTRPIFDAIQLSDFWQETLTNPQIFWTALAAVGTLLAVLVALFLPVWRRRRERSLAVQVAVPAIADEFRHVADIAERAHLACRTVRAARIQNLGGSIVVMPPDLDTAACDAFSDIDFPAFRASGELLRGAYPKVVAEITRAHGDIYRYVSAFKTSYGKLKADGDIQAHIRDMERHSGQVLGRARYAFGFSAAVADLDYPEDWVPRGADTSDLPGPKWRRPSTLKLIWRQLLSLRQRISGSGNE